MNVFVERYRVSCVLHLWRIAVVVSSVRAGLKWWIQGERRPGEPILLHRESGCGHTEALRRAAPSCCGVTPLGQHWAAFASPQPLREQLEGCNSSCHTNPMGRRNSTTGQHDAGCCVAGSVFPASDVFLCERPILAGYQLGILLLIGSRGSCGMGN